MRVNPIEKMRSRVKALVRATEARSHPDLIAARTLLKMLYYEKCGLIG